MSAKAELQADLSVDEGSWQDVTGSSFLKSLDSQKSTYLIHANTWVERQNDMDCCGYDAPSAHVPPLDVESTTTGSRCTTDASKGGVLPFSLVPVWKRFMQGWERAIQRAMGISSARLGPWWHRQTSSGDCSFTASKWRRISSTAYRPLLPLYYFWSSS